MADSKDESEQQAQNEMQPSLKPLKRLTGFQDPEVRAKAMEKSQATRARMKKGSLAPISVEGISKYAEDGSFKPTKDMVRVLTVALSMESGNKLNAWFKSAGLHRNTWYVWQKLEGFTEWWDRAYVKGLTSLSSEWLKIGAKKMHQDVKYWLAMGKLVFGFIEKVSIKEEKTEDEQALTNELLKFFVGKNKAEDIEQAKKVIDISDSDIKELNTEIDFSEDDIDNIFKERDEE